MPFNLDGPLTQELMIRQGKEATSPSKGLSPTIMALIGSAVDGASTYHAMKNGSREDNAMLQGGSPLATGLAVAGSGLAGIGLSKLIGMKYPKLAHVLMANQAAQQLGMGTQNLAGNINGLSSVDTVNNGITQAIKNDPNRFVR